MALKKIVNNILWNLDIISNIKNNETLMVSNDKIQIDNRWTLFGIRRMITQDDRYKVVEKIRDTLDQLEELIVCYRLNKYLHQSQHQQMEVQEVLEDIKLNLQEIIERKNEFVKGLKVLSTFSRYVNDANFQVFVRSFIKRFEAICTKCESLITILTKSDGIEMQNIKPVNTEQINDKDENDDDDE